MASFRATRCQRPLLMIRRICWTLMCCLPAMGMDCCMPFMGMAGGVLSPLPVLRLRLAMATCLA